MTVEKGSCNAINVMKIPYALTEEEKSIAFLLIVSC